jgi:hypothetical protein
MRADTDKPKSDMPGAAKATRIYSIGAIFLGSACLLWGIFLYIYYDSIEFIEQSVEKPGVVVELLKVNTRKSRVGEMTKNYITYSPIVEYTDDSGQQRFYRSTSSSNPAAYEIGEAVTLLVNPLNPKDIRIKGFSELYAGLWIVGLIALVFTLIGLGACYLNLKPEKPKQQQWEYTPKTVMPLSMEAGNNGKPPVGSALLKNITIQHLPFFLVLFILGAVFSCVGGGLIYYSTEISIKLFGCLFMLPGLGILIFAFVSNIKSISYYYNKCILKTYGREVLAKITEKHVDEFIDRNNRSDASEEDVVIERDYRVVFCYSFNAASYNSECFLDKQELFESLEIGQEIPVLVLPYKPDIAHPRIKKLTFQMKLKNPEQFAKPENNVITSESLLNEDDF